MTYFADLTTYVYSEPVRNGVKNVGWLDDLRPFTKGIVEPGFLKKLKYLCKTKAIRTSLGAHECELCEKYRKHPETLVPEEHKKLENINNEIIKLEKTRANSERIRMLSDLQSTLQHQIDKNLKNSLEWKIAKQNAVSDMGELWIKGDGAVYAAPVMIYHFVEVHGYKPPDVFIDAVMAS